MDQIAHFTLDAHVSLTSSLIVDGTKLADECIYNGRFWAPEIHRALGKYWLTVNTGNGADGKPQRMYAHAIHLFMADEITGPYRWVTNQGPIGPPFKNDASPFTDDDGRSYLYCSGGGLSQAQIDLPAGRIIGRSKLERIMSPQRPCLPDWMIGGIEGPFVIRRGGIYYMFFSPWTRGYELGVMSADSPLGPWRLSNKNLIFGTRKRWYRQRQVESEGYAHVTFEDTRDPFVEVGHCAVSGVWSKRPRRPLRCPRVRN